MLAAATAAVAVAICWADGRAGAWKLADRVIDDVTSFATHHTIFQLDQLRIVGHAVGGGDLDEALAEEAPYPSFDDRAMAQHDGFGTQLAADLREHLF